MPGVTGRVRVDARGLTLCEWAGATGELLGLSADMLGRSPRALGWRILPADLTPLLSAMQTALESGEPQSVEARILDKDDRPRPLLVWLAGATEDEVLVWDVVAVDISAQKARESELLTEKRQLHLVLSNIPLLVLDLDPAGAIRFADGKGFEILGVSPHHIVDLSVFELFADVPELIADVERALAGQSFRSTARIGELVFDTTFEPLSRRQPDGRRVITGAVVVLADVSERARAQEARRRSEASFRTLIESSPDAIFVHRFGRLVYVNEAVVELLGYRSAADLVGRPVLDLMAMEDRATAAQHIRALIDSPEVVTDEQRLLRRDGSTAVLEMRTMPLVFDGEPAIVHVGRDVTERKRLQAKLLQTDRLASLGVLAEGVAHEINNPLAYMTANLMFLSEETERLAPPGSEEFEEVITAIRDTRDGAERVRQIVRQLSAFARLDDNDDSEMDICDLVDGSLRLAWTQLRRRACLHLDYRAQAEVVGNQTGLGQVFLNLLVNAGQAVFDNEEGHRDITLRVELEDQHVVVEVRDNGCGIDAEIIDNIFDPFFSTKPTGQGTGLGLSVCHSIVANLGGTISVSSHPGRGASFRVRLPCKGGRAPNTAVRRDILVVEDETWTLQPLQEALRGNDVTIASTARMAVLACEQRRYDLILCDLSVRDVDAGVFLDRLRHVADELLERVVFLTSPSTPAPPDYPRLAKPLASADVAALLDRTGHRAAG